MAVRGSRRLAAALGRWPRWAALSLGGAVVIGAIAAAFFGYRTWDYIEHDNEFCLSCHLMAEPYEQFAESAHRGLGCKACHKPDFMSRSQMALTQILENPDSLGVHAEVPNEKCAECHVEGDPDAWRQIAASAGHKVHFESSDSALSGLQCVGCHSSSVHEFAATDQTCGQAGCHEDTRVRLGRMGDLTIHCVACHEFTRPIEEGGEATLPVSVAAENPLRPAGAECLSCHAMRRIVGEIPEDEPHGGACGACHDPHEQTTPAEAVESCGAAGCHAAADTLTPMHRGLPEGALANCTLCHAAHDSEFEAPACSVCHVDPDGRAVPPPPPGGAGVAGPIGWLPRLVGPSPLHAQEGRARAQRPSGGTVEGFTHGEHRSVGCLECHSTEETHGATVVRTAADCSACHHAEPPARECAACHPPVRLRGETALSRTLAMPIGGSAARRTLAFDHDPHRRLGCGECHATGPDRSAASTSCADCHEDHHLPTATCSACHVEAPVSAHPIEVVHQTCGGAGCHAAERFPPTPPPTRTACLVCHQALEDHEPGRSCGACHAVGEAHAPLSRARPGTP